MWSLSPRPLFPATGSLISDSTTSLPRRREESSEESLLLPVLRKILERETPGEPKCGAGFHSHCWSEKHIPIGEYSGDRAKAHASPVTTLTIVPSTLTCVPIADGNAHDLANFPLLPGLSRLRTLPMSLAGSP